MSIYMVNGREVELPDEVGDFLTFARECPTDQCVAIIGRCAVLAIRSRVLGQGRAEDGERRHIADHVDARQARGELRSGQ